MESPYLACPYSLEPDDLGEVHPHQAGMWIDTRDGLRRCAVCGRTILGALRSGRPQPPPISRREEDWTYRREDGSIYVPPPETREEKDARYRAEFRALIAPILAALPETEP
jgi:hypothetical protein